MREHRAGALPTGTVTPLITDVEGSRALLLDAGERCAAILQRHDQIVRSVVAARRGTTVSTVGDSVLAVCPAASAGVAAAVPAASVARADRAADPGQLRAGRGPVPAWPQTSSRLRRSCGSW